MDTNTKGYGLLGIGKCKNVEVEICAAPDESHYELSISISLESTPAHYRIRMESLEQIQSLFHFISDHIGTDGYYQNEVIVSLHTKLVIAKDDEFNDRFFLKIVSNGLFIEQTLGGFAAASLMKALLPALQEARGDNKTSM